MDAREIINEIVYKGNLGIHELFLFYDKATPAQIKKLEGFLAAQKTKQAFDLMSKVLGYSLNKESSTRLKDLIPDA